MKKACSISIIVAMIFSGMSWIGDVEESHAAGTVCDIVVSMPDVVSQTLECNGQGDVGSATLEIPYGITGNITIEYINLVDEITIDSFKFDNADSTTFIFDAGGVTEQATLTWYYDDMPNVVLESTFTVQAKQETPEEPEEPEEPEDPGYIIGVSVNGQSGAPTANFDGEMFTYYSYSTSTSQTPGTIALTFGDYVAEINGDDLGIESTGQASASNIQTSQFDYSMTDTTEWYIRIISVEETVELHLKLTYSTPSPSPSNDSGGGGGSSSTTKEEIDVINETNQTNESSDTILTPASTTEKDGESTTNVTSTEVSALIALAEKHETDLAEGDNEAIISIEDKAQGGNQSYEVSLTQKDADSIADSIVDVLSVNTSIGDFRIRTEELSSIVGKSGGKLKFQLFKIENEGRPGVDAKLSMGNVIVSQFENTYTVEIRIPYEAAEGEDISGLFVEYLKEDGTTQIVTESKYDPENKWLVFFASHLSKYGVSYKPVLFSDVPAKHWANSYVTFLASRGVINGMGGKKFYPDAKVTKAQFINMMTKAFSAATLGKNTIKSYKDVPLDAWYAKAVGWSYMNNLSNVLAKNGLFYPDANLTREDMATLSNNISLGLGLRLKTKTNSVSFADNSAISSYARSGVERMSGCGIIAGAGGGKFMPKQGLTRAEAAKIISTLMSQMR